MLFKYFLKISFGITVAMLCNWLLAILVSCKYCFCFQECKWNRLVNSNAGSFCSRWALGTFSILIELLTVWVCLFVTTTTHNIIIHSSWTGSVRISTNECNEDTGDYQLSMNECLCLFYVYIFRWLHNENLIEAY